MGCGSSTHTSEATTAGPINKPEKHPSPAERGNNNGGAHSTDAGRKAKEIEKQPNVEKEPPKVEQDQPQATAQTGTPSKVVETVEPDQDREVVLPSREKCFPGTKLTASSNVVTICYSQLTPKNGLTFACFNVKTGEVHHTALTDDEITTLKEETSKDLDWTNFWKSLTNAFNKGYVSLKGDDGVLEIKMKQSKEPKDVLCKVRIEKGEEDVLTKHFILNYPKIRMSRLEQGKDKEKDKDKSAHQKREGKIAQAEAILEAGLEAERVHGDVLPELREKAKKAKRAVSKQEAKTRKIHSELNRLNGIIPSHPLDDMYNPVAPAVRDFKEIDVSDIGWDTDVFQKKWQLGDVALALFRHYKLTSHFAMDEKVLKNFLGAMEDLATKHENKFHNSLQTASMLCCVHHLLQRLQEPLNMTYEDTFSVLLATSMYNVGHEGVDNHFMKRAQSMLSMLYSDLYSNAQNNSTAAFELMGNPHLNIMGSMTADGARDIAETVREIIVIKANVQMATEEERIQDFTALVDSPECDWSNKDNQRIALTHLVSMAHWSSWAQKHELAQKWTLSLSEELYQQGEKETALGLMSSNFNDTNWTTDSARHDADFATGQVEIINSVVLPLAKGLTAINKDLQHIVDTASSNKTVWEEDGGGECAKAQKAIEEMGWLYRDVSGGVLSGRPGPDGLSIWLTALKERGDGYSATFDESFLSKKGSKVTSIIADFDGDVVVDWGPNSCTATFAGVPLELPETSHDIVGMMMREIASSAEIRGLEKTKDLDKKTAEYTARVKQVGNKAVSLYGEEKALKGCIEACNAKVSGRANELDKLEEELRSKGGDPTQKLEIEDALAIKVRNPLKAPLPPGVLKPPDCKEVDTELLKLLKSRYWSDAGGAEEEPASDSKHCNVIKPYLSSEFAQVTSSINDSKRQLIYDLISKLDDWDFNVFELQTAMSGGISGEYLRDQPNGGALFVTMYALCYKWRFMQIFNINEQTLINWLSIVEAGYHPNPYHNSMHAADVLHVTHYILAKGGCKASVKATDAEIFAALFAAAIHDYNHPGINNAFHVRSQNYLAILFNDRSVNENIHASSVFELMRMDEFNILNAFQGDDYMRMREDIVEFVLGTDMGLHSMFVTRFKKRIDETEMKMYKTKKDKNLALTMALKMADISNCGRPKTLYHGWCNVIVDEFFQQGDRERLQGMPVSPFMDRYVTIMSKGQIGFMNYIVMPLFECMGEFLEHMQMATSIVDENKGFWQNNEDW
eukprot:TRINITY_DN27893_c0_g1_i1.p1 TRINITY_DN27893_c0_g1~~TRINITY_DN27893_c0_g1_i1.p1  ORF type:complete len:1249 (+),score=414.61 TRINITY_DN27893_c0_g1_i1:72-3818(+)